MIEIDPIDFHDWPGLHALLMGAFAFMAGRIDPPSSLLRMSAETLRDKAGQEQLLLIREASGTVACLFARETADGDYYIGKLAVRPDRQGEGLARQLVEAAAGEARRRGLAALTLETRVELRENHRSFRAMGFRLVGASAHAGFDRATSLRFRRPL